MNKYELTLEAPEKLNGRGRIPIGNEKVIVFEEESDEAAERRIPEFIEKEIKISNGIELFEAQPIKLVRVVKNWKYKHLERDWSGA